MLEEQKLLLQILSDYVHHEKTSITKQMDWNLIFMYGRIHQITGIIYQQCKDFIPDKGKYESDHAITVYAYARRKSAIKEFENVLKDHDYIFFKGMQVADLYPFPQLRTMGDVDVLVHVQDRDAVCEALYNHGFSLKYKEEKETGTWHLQKNMVEFEIHRCLLHENQKQEPVYEYLADPWSHEEKHQLDWEYHFILLLAHLREHILETGVGIRQFMDLAIVVNNVELDWNRVLNDIENLKMTTFFMRVMTVLKSWFHVEIACLPIEYDEDFVELVTDKIMEAGVFGFNNTDNLYNYVLQKTAHDGSMYAVKRFARAVFLPYRTMISIPDYAFLKGKPYLLPLAWGYRIILKWKSRNRIRQKYLISDARVRSRIDYLRLWGL